MEPARQSTWQGDEINLLDYWRVLLKRGRMILGLTCISVLTAGSYSYFFLPKIFESTASILAPKDPAGAGPSLASALAASGASQMLGAALPTGTTTRDTFVSILKSRTMAQELVDRFKLKEYFRTQLMGAAIKRLQGTTNIAVSREGVISVTVEDTDPKLAADMANAYITNLDRMFANLGTTEASRQRMFIAERLEKTERTLRGAEEALRRFQENKKAIVIQEQARSGIEAAAQVKGEIIAAEAQLEFLRAFATENNPQVLQQRRKIEEMKRQLAQMQYGRGLDLPSETLNPGQRRREFQIPFTSVPEVGMEYLRLARDVKVQETVFTLLTAQYEQTKINEARDTPTVQPLDRAVPAERKSKPKTVLNMAMAGAISLFVGMFLAFFLEYVERIRRPQAASG
ncbi:MAG: hypothetical protein HY613_10295 [Candidatus Rokubacteria bacterium]|nr:hypothetical protein [Candidatus Rokubacteria bacterium]